jgi:DNA repair protein RadC
MDPKHRELLQARVSELRSKIGSGGLREAGIRALLYVGSARGMVDERSLEALRRLRQADESARLTLAEFKMLVREQFFMLLLDREAALAAIPKLLPDNMDERRRAFAAIEDVLAASAGISGEVAKRLKQVAGLFGLEDQGNTVPFDPKARVS